MYRINVSLTYIKKAFLHFTFFGIFGSLEMETANPMFLAVKEGLCSYFTYCVVKDKYSPFWNCYYLTEEKIFYQNG